VLTFALTLKIAKLILDFFSARLNFPRLILFSISLIAINVERITLIIKLVLDYLIKSSIYL